MGGKGRRGSEGSIERLRSSRGRRAGMELAGAGPGMREEANGVEPDTLDRGQGSTLVFVVPVDACI